MEVTREIRRYGDFSLPGVVLAAAWRAVKISKSVFRPCTLSHPWGGGRAPGFQPLKMSLDPIWTKKSEKKWGQQGKSADMAISHYPGLCSPQRGEP